METEDRLAHELGEVLELGEARLEADTFAEGLTLRRKRRPKRPGRPGTCPVCGLAVMLRLDGHPRQHGECPEGKRKRRAPRDSKHSRERCPRCARFICVRDDGKMRRHRNDADEPCEAQQLALTALLQEAPQV